MDAPPQPDARLKAMGVGFRHAARADLDFLRRAYASFRAEEMASVGWSEAAKSAFLDSQFDLQHADFVRTVPRADFLVVEQTLPPAAAAPVGRLYLGRAKPLWSVIDIGLLAAARGRGLGAAMLQWLQAAAPAAGAEGLKLQVLVFNPRARALYDRLGFVPEGEIENGRQKMVWRAA